MANPTHTVKSDIKHPKQAPQKGRGDEQRTDGDRAKQPQKPAQSGKNDAGAEQGFDAPGAQRPPSDS